MCLQHRTQQLEEGYHLLHKHSTSVSLFLCVLSFLFNLFNNMFSSHSPHSPGSQKTKHTRGVAGGVVDGEEDDVRVVVAALAQHFQALQPETQRL